jgi:hypothetical protein
MDYRDLLRQMTAQMATRVKIETKMKQVKLDEDKRQRVLDQKGRVFFPLL